MTKQRGTPDRRGMGAQSDFIAEQFIPSDTYRARQLEMMRALQAAGCRLEELESMFLVPCHLIARDNPALK